jgi:hypothetical protein
MSGTGCQELVFFLALSLVLKDCPRHGTGPDPGPRPCPKHIPESFFSYGPCL